MLDILLLGLNHKTAPVELRECLGFSNDEAGVALKNLRKYPSIKEAVIISTCNRVEILMAVEDISDTTDNVIKFISEFKNVPVSRFEKSLYIHNGEAAVRHVFRVASSLDSMMVGEPQILGQIKEAYRTATLKKTSGVILNRLLHRTFFVAKRVRSTTGIGDNTVSISYAAIELGRKIFGTLEKKKVLLVGAGEMAELAIEHLISNRVGEIFVANRTFKHGVKLAGKFNGIAIKFEEILSYLQHVDIVISSTTSPEFIIKPEHVKKAMRSRRNRPVFFIDIAVPRDIDPEINKITNAYVYDIDDLKGVIDENIKDRYKEAVKGERLVDEAVIRFRQWYDSLEVIPTVVALRNKIDAIAKSEIDKTLRSLNHFSENDREAFYRMANALTNKIMHDPTIFLKNNGFHGNKSNYLDLTRKLFKLDNPG